MRGLALLFALGCRANPAWWDSAAQDRARAPTPAAEPESEQPEAQPAAQQPSSWLGGRGTAALSGSLASGFCNIPRIPAAELTPQRFREEFEGRRPFILTGATASWGAAGWTLAEMQANASRHAAQVEAAEPKSGEAHLARTFADDLENLFVSGDTVAKRASKLVVDGYALSSPLLRAGYRVPEWASRTATEAGGLRNFVGEWRLAVAQYIHNLTTIMQRQPMQRQPTTAGERYYIIGPSGAGGVPHIDVDNQSFWNALVHGRKRWLLLSPARLQQLIDEDPTAVASWHDKTAHAWYSDGWAARVEDSKVSAQPMRQSEYGTSALTLAGGWGQEGWWECEQQEGELIYGVGGMLHAVLSLTDSFSLSEQMLGPTDFSGSVTFRRLADEGLVEMGLCDAGVEEFRLQTVKQVLALAAAADWTKKIEHAEIRDPTKRGECGQRGPTIEVPAAQL